MLTLYVYGAWCGVRRPGATGAAGTASPPAGPVLGWGAGSEERGCSCWDGAGGAWHRSALHSGSWLLLCKTNQPTPVVFCLHKSKFVVAQSCGFVRVQLWCSDTCASCFPHMGYPWAGSASRTPPWRAPVGSLLRQRVSPRAFQSIENARPVRAGASSFLAPAAWGRCWCVQAGLRAGARGAVTTRCSLGWCLGGLLAPGEAREGCSPSPAALCALRRDLHFQFTMAVSRWNITAQTLCHRGGCAKCVNSTGAGASPGDVIFNRSGEVGGLWGSVCVLMQPHLSARVGEMLGLNRIQVWCSV